MADDSNTTLRACSKCGVEKTPDCFGKNQRKCRACVTAWLREARRKDPERYREYDRRNAEKNKAPGSDYQKRRYALADKEKKRENLRRWKAENPDKLRAIEAARNERVNQQRRDDPATREKLNKKSREWQSNKRQSDPSFRAKCNEQNREWHASNKENLRPYYRDRAARLRKTDLGYRVMCSLRRRVHTALRGARKSASVSALLGCSLDEARSHIEAQFQPGMTWDNWGRGWAGAREWHLDHVKPLASFDLTDAAQMAEACHYTNLQPLWAKDNIAKGSTL